MKFKRIIALLSAAALIFTLCSCKKENSKKKISVIVKAVDSDFWHRVKSGVDSAATEYNIDAEFTGPENEEDYEAQNRLIENAVKNGAEAIVVSAIDYKKSAEAVNSAARAGVKIVAIDSEVDSQNVSTFIGTDNYEAGKAAAKAAVAGFSKESNINIGLINYYENTANGHLREEGFKDYISGTDNAEIIASATADSNTESAEQAAVRLLNEHPEINVIAGFNEWMTLGIGNAVKKLNLSQKVYAVGFDTNTVSLGMLETGEIDALIVQNPFAIGYMGLKCAAGLISGETYQSEQYTAVTAVTKNNMFDKEIQKLLFTFENGG